MSTPLRLRFYIRVHWLPRKILDETLPATSAAELSRQTAARLRALADEIDQRAAEQEQEG